MRRGVSGAVLAALVGLAAAALASPVAADWLVTRDGTHIETRGPWEVRGRTVVFTGANGTLSSMRLSEVDLEASTAATERAKAPPPPREEQQKPPEGEKEPVLVLTDADVGHVEHRRPAVSAEAGAEAASGSPLEVVSWSEINEPDTFDVQIFGTLRNNGEEVATEISLEVRLLDADGKLLAETPAVLTQRNLSPGESTNFRAAFPGIFGFNAIRFDARHASFKIQVPPEEAGGEGGSEEGGSPPEEGV